MIRYLEVPTQDTGPAANVDEHRCALGEHCCAQPAAPLGWAMSVRDDFHPVWGDTDVRWVYPFVPADANPLDTSLWVCEDCASWIEDMWALRELFVGLP